MENTVAFSFLMDIIKFVGNFITAPIFFNLSILNILFISFILTHIISICIGGFPSRARNVRIVDSYDKKKINDNVNNLPAVTSKGNIPYRKD